MRKKGRNRVRGDRERQTDSKGRYRGREWRD